MERSTRLGFHNPQPVLPKSLPESIMSIVLALARDVRNRPNAQSIKEMPTQDNTCLTLNVPVTVGEQNVGDVEVEHSGVGEVWVRPHNLGVVPPLDLAFPERVVSAQEPHAV